MKILANSSVLIQFGPDRQDEAKSIVNEMRQRMMDAGCNVEVAWDLDHVRIIGRMEVGEKK